jgi:hypothetical protein
MPLHGVPANRAGIGKIRPDLLDNSQENRKEISRQGRSMRE